MTQTKEAPQPVLREDYREPTHLIDTVDLNFDLREEGTRVRARLEGRRHGSGDQPLVLAGEELKLISISLDGKLLAEGDYVVEEESLTVSGVGETFVLETEVEIQPQANKTLSGLYKSSGNFSTQCESEGFRRITWFLDRPDVMATYRVRVEADEKLYPVLLSNGNRGAVGKLDDGRHWASWEDPFKKPSYLFALVAGQLHCHEGSFTTRSGRKVELEIWVEPQNADSCEHALKSLQKSMTWDEETFGLEYDLDLYMIVAVNDFNMGAMENKGLNIFNSKYVLAKPETATDDDYEGVEGVIAHEYFHNWTGNRVTCHDWFQLTLKEGLTVFRDQQFTADMTSAAVKRVGDVNSLRVVQFAEDAGPMSHPVRPESYIEMNNFYTATVYSKGAEVVRMYHTLLGADGFRRGMDLYFERHDGQAVSCDDFRAAMGDANGADMEQFGRWYAQKGTPTIKASGEWSDDGKYVLTLSQSSPDGCDPLHVPVRTSLLGKDGTELSADLEGAEGSETERVLELREARQSFTFTGLEERPYPSLLRGFSAPVKLETERSSEELAFAMASETDPFNRWDAGQELAKQLLLKLAADQAAGRPLAMDQAFVDAYGRILADPVLDGSLKSQALVLPGEKLLGQSMETIDVDALYAARCFARKALAGAHREAFRAAYDENTVSGSYSNDKVSVAKRRLKNTALAMLVALEEPETTALAAEQFGSADNMTDSQAALTILSNTECPEREAALADFYGRWKDDPLVIDKWFTVQAISTLPGAVDQVLALRQHADFTIETPNRVRALVGAFAAGNQVRFHAKDGRGYDFLAETVLELDGMNPQIASRMVSIFNPWRRFDAARQALMRAQLERIAAKDGLSRDVFEIISRSLSS